MLLALGGCGWPALEPDDRAWPIDARMGTEVFRTDHGLRVASAFQGETLQIAFEVIADGWQFVEVSDDGAIETLPPPPLPPDATIRMGVAGAPDRAAIADYDGGLEVHLLDASGWRTLPSPDVIGTAEDLGTLLTHGGRVYVGFAGRVLVWDGDAWSEPVVAPSVALGGFDDATQWMLAGDTAGFAAIAVDAAGAAGAPIAGPAGVPVPGAALNGDASGFELLAGDQLWTFDGAAFAPGDAVVADALLPAPGASAAVLRTGVGPSGTYVVSEGGALGDVALAPFTPAIDCGCDVAIDDACACVPHTVGLVDVDVDWTLAHLALTMADAIDGYGVLTVRFLDLPFAGDPFASSP